MMLRRVALSPWPRLAGALAALLIAGSLEPSPAVAAERVLFYHNDTLGSPVAMTDAAGVVVWRADYEPFGALATESGVVGTAHQFTGKERDVETGLHYFGARYYDGALGRFTSPDPFNPIHGFTSGEELGAYLSNPQRWNKYAYALNNPFKYVDPDGNYAILIYLQQALQRLATSPTAQRVGTYVSTKGTRLYNAATRFFNSPAGQEAVQTAAETVSGVPMPTSPASFNPVRAAENLGLRGITSSGGWVIGRLANGADVGATFSRSGDHLAVNIWGAFNPEGTKGSLGTLNMLFKGAMSAARAEAATSVTIRAVGVVNDRLASVLQRRGWQRVMHPLPDGTSVEALERTLPVR